jgi:hypothetical protein
MKLIFTAVSIILASSVMAQGLINFSAGQLRDRSLPIEVNQVIYTVTGKSNSISLKIHENIFQGEFKKKFSLIDVAELKAHKTYIVPECLKENHRYLLAGDIFIHNKAFFTGVVIGIPNYHGKAYICSIKKNNGILPAKPRRDIGPFEIGYHMVEGLIVGFVDEVSLKNKLLEI